MYDTRSHGESGNTGCTDHGVDLILAEQVDEFSEEHAANSIKYKGNQTKQEDKNRFPAQECFGVHIDGYCNSQEIVIKLASTF